MGPDCLEGARAAGSGPAVPAGVESNMKGLSFPSDTLIYSLGVTSLLSTASGLSPF